MSYEFGNRQLSASVPVLVSALQSESDSVRLAAAEALGKIGDPRSGYDLDKHLATEEDLGVRFMLIAGLGGTYYREAIPKLISFLNDPNSQIRHSAAWALGHMNAAEARSALQDAIVRESHPGLSASWNRR